MEPLHNIMIPCSFWILYTTPAWAGGSIEADDIFDGWVWSLREDDQACGVFGGDGAGRSVVRAVRASG